MPLDETQRQKIHAWLADKKIKKCPICGGQHLEVHDSFYGLIKVEEDRVDVGRGLEHIVLECEACGYLMPFHAWTLKLK
jgi:hypothetical protein